MINAHYQQHPLRGLFLLALTAPLFISYRAWYGITSLLFGNDFVDTWRLMWSAWRKQR